MRSSIRLALTVAVLSLGLRPLAALEPVKISAPLPENGRIHAFDLAPDGIHAVYWGTIEADSRFDLYGAPTDGGPAYKLNGQVLLPNVAPDWVIS